MATQEYTPRPYRPRRPTLHDEIMEIQALMQGTAARAVAEGNAHTATVLSLGTMVLGNLSDPFMERALRYERQRGKAAPGDDPEAA